MMNVERKTARTFFVVWLIAVVLGALMMAKVGLPAHQPLPLLNWTPGLQGLAKESKFPLSVVIGVGMAVIGALFASILMSKSSDVQSVFNSHLKHISIVQKLLYSGLGLLAVLLPIFSPTARRGHMISTPFFELVANEAWALASFCAGIYIFDTAVFLLIASLLFTKRKST